MGGSGCSRRTRRAVAPGRGRPRQLVDVHVVALEGLHEGLDHAVAPGRVGGCGAHPQAEALAEVAGAPGGVDDAVVQQPLHRVGACH